MEKSYGVLYLTAPTADITVRLNSGFPISGGTSCEAISIGTEPGGAGNTLITFQRMGGAALAVGPVGNDCYGRFLLNAYREQGLETAYLTVVENYLTAAAICILAPDGTHSFLSAYHSCNFADAGDVTALLRQCSGVCLSGYNLTADVPEFCALSMALLREAHAMGMHIFFDPGPLIPQISAEHLNEVLEKATAVILNDEEAAQITGLPDPLAAALALSGRTKAQIIVKAGARGCAAAICGEGKRYPGFRVALADTSGAGDSFLGAYMYAVTEGWDTATCLIFANAAGAVKASKRGTGTQVPNFGEVVAILQQNGYNIPQETLECGRFLNLKLS